MVMRISRVPYLALLAVGLIAGCEGEQERADQPFPPELVDEAERTLKLAATYFHDEVSVEGSYVWRVSPDGAFRSGEGKTDDRQGWVQAPGTPAVGSAYIAAYEATDDPYYWEAALNAGRALARTQLLSGGWHALMEFDPDRREAWCYRQDRTVCDKVGARRENRHRDASLLDDDITQGALRFLILLDQSDQDTPEISEAARYGVAKLVEAQYPNGAWPFNLARRVNKAKQEAELGAKGRYPAEWSRTFTKTPSPEYFVLNDHAMSNAIRTMLLAHQRYGEDRFLESALRAGDFLLAAQMPAPQSGWAHVYSATMEPIWGRKFEPPALASWETASTIGVLIDLYRYTSEERFWEGAEKGVAWLERVRIGDNLWSRFYELETDQPLYMTKDYQLTHDDSDLPKHYGFQDTFGIPAMLTAYQQAKEARANGEGPSAPLPPEIPREAELVEIIDTLDQEGRWIEDSLIHSTTFVGHAETLAKAIAHMSGRQRSAESQFLPRAGLL